MQPHHHQSNMAQMAQHTKCTKKAKEKGGREREKGGKNAGSNRKIKKNKKKTHARKFSHHDPFAMTFCECKILAVLDCEE